ncbi:hypothetical protein [Paenibacillus rigui]|uniref:Uncharacterized protein n=1 Tax=Paenibacillus rigui TaxID=554312 RepID=A0A229UK48_9BACL|nr:hypothetical protein [Paenibacillus rigui]OXM83685.1 hypothetical protein CF651_24105 [Paenibacillus rigui]
MELELRELDIDLLSESSDHVFDIEQSVETSNESLRILMGQHPENDCNFENNQWYVVHEGSAIRLNFDFEITAQHLRFNSDLGKIEKEKFIVVVKSWIASLLTYLDVYSVLRYYRYLNRIVEVSKCFNPDENTLSLIKDTVERIDQETEHTAFITCLGVLNFLDYYQEIDTNSVYLRLFRDLKEVVRSPNNIRDLPLPKDVFLFDKIVEDYFTSLERGSAEYLLYFPIYLWWNLTNIIPLRPFEFCGVKRDALLFKEDSFFLRLPRSSKKGSKNRNRDRIQVVDTIKISFSLGTDIETYIKFSDCFGITDTLISHTATVQLKCKLFKNYYSERKIDTEKYTVSSLYRDIKFFYAKVIEKHFGYSVRPLELKDRHLMNVSDRTYDISCMIRPGDTRHFAFLNLMRLGYNPVEIARMGGHIKLNTQYHYHRHKEFMLNVEVLKLMDKFKYERTFSTFQGSCETKITLNNKMSCNFGLALAVEDTFVSVIPLVGKKLEFGHCTDPLQRCIFHDCAFCDYWKISYEEYIQNKEKIQREIEVAYDTVKALLESMEKIHLFIINRNDKSPDANEMSMDLNRDLAVLSKKLDKSIEEYIELMSIVHRKVITDEHK